MRLQENQFMISFLTIGYFIIGVSIYFYYPNYFHTVKYHTPINKPKTDAFRLDSLTANLPPESADN